MATEIKKSQIKILIKLGFFKDFGNSKMLLRLYDVFEQFKFGEAASISKSKLENAPEIREIVKRYSNSKTKDGKESATFKILNIKVRLVSTISNKKRDSINYLFISFLFYFETLPATFNTSQVLENGGA